ncbi:MAG: PIN domain-containing protein [Sulfuricella sp.]|nr:PIN domain-containing protein [Sulfuricella sp.]
MNAWLLDTSALPTLRDDEPGADRAAEVLTLAQRGEVTCFGCFISLMEQLCRVWRDEGESAGHLAYEQCLSLPIAWIHESSDLLVKAAEIKAHQRVFLADAWIAACTVLHGATLLHKDPEFTAISLKQEALPFKGKAA